jgi:sirohydrochlorin ferrochelatase
MMDVILLGHGSHRTPDTDQGLREIHRRLQARLAGESRVALAFFEFLHPTLAETVAEVAASGARRAVLMPYFLFEGREIQRDIPGELAHLREQHPALAVTMAATLGTHPNMVAVAADRVRAALEESDGTRVGEDARRAFGERPDEGGPTDARAPEDAPGSVPLQSPPARPTAGHLGVVLVNRGVRRQYDDGSRLAELCRLLGERLNGEVGGHAGDALVAPALAENSPRTVEVVAAELIGRGARRIVVLPYLHFPGKVLLESVVPATERARAAHPEVPHMLAATLGVDDRIVAVCAERVRAALAGLTRA